jgi:hypothetical protein
MADLQTLNEEEFNSLHPSLQEYFKAGIDTNPYGDRLVTEKNFFNLNLFGSDYNSLDPNLTERTEKNREKLGIGGAAKYGFKSGVSAGMELLGSIPGGLDRFYDWSRTTLGFEPTEDSIFDHVEDYLKDIAQKIGPDERMLKPTGFAEKVAAGFGEAIPAIISYIPAIKGLQALRGVGRLGTALANRNLPAGIALTDITREIDDGKFHDIAMAGAYGYGTGKILQIANRLNILPRMGVLGATGFVSAGWESSLEDRLAATTVWAGLGAFGPIAEGKSIKRTLTDYELQAKQLVGQIEKPTSVKERSDQIRLEIDGIRKQIDEKGLAGKELEGPNKQIATLEKTLNQLSKVEDQLGPVRMLAAENIGKIAVTIRKHETILEAHNKALKFEETNKELISQGKEPKPTPKEFQDNLLSTEQAAKVEKHIRDLKDEAKAFGKVVYNNTDYNIGIFGRDTRSVDLFKQDMFNEAGNAKYNDLPVSTMQTVKQLAQTPKFMEHPVVKYVNDKIEVFHRKTENLAEQIAYDPAFTMNSKLFPGRNKGEPLGDYVLRLNSSFEAVRSVGMRKLRTLDGSLTEFNVLTQKNPLKTKQFVDKAFRIEIDKQREAKKNREKYTTRVEPNEGRVRESTKDLTPDEIKRIEDLQQSRTESNKMEIDAEINNILGKNPFVPLKEGYFKYEVTNKELKEKYKMDEQEIRMYRGIRGAVDKVVDTYNASVKNNKDNNGATVIEKIPNYLPHIFEGDFRVFLKTWKGKKGYQVDTAVGASNKASANSIAKYFQEEYGAVLKDSKSYNTKVKDGDYIVQIGKINKEPIGTEQLSAFNRLFENYDLTESAFIKYQEAIDKARQQTGFKKFSIQRQGVKGFLGSEINAREFFLKSLRKDKNLNLKQSRDFESAILTYIKGGLRAADRLDFNREFGRIMNEPIIAADGSRKTVAQVYPNAKNLAEQLKQNAYGELSTNKFIEKFEQIGSDYIGQSGLARFLGGANQVTLNFKLLFGNMRFILSQALQPYHMIFPKLMDLKYSGFDKGNVALSQVKAFKDLFFPNKEMKEVIEYMYKNNVVEQKFLNEASAGLKPLLGAKEFKKLQDPFGRKVFDYNRLLKVLTLQDVSGKVEQVSRLNASLMFYNLFKSAGKSKQYSLENAAYLANKYMVEYNYLEQPGIYGARGMGAIGKPFGLFKTFQHNYLSQLAEYATKAYKGKGEAGLVAFMTQMVFAAGVFGVIGYQTAETILEKMSPTIQKITGKPLPSLTELMLTSDIPNVVKYGIPSAALDVDLTATLAAPGVSVQDLVSVPALDFLGLNPIRPFEVGKGRGLIPSSLNYLIKLLASDDPYEKREAYVQFLQSGVPTSMQGAVEAYYMGIPNPTSYWKFWSLKNESEDIFKYPNYGPQRDPFKRGRGEVIRTFGDWRARTLSAYSLDEKEALKLVYVTTRLKSNLRDDISSYLVAGAHHLMKDGFVPLYLVDKLMKFGLTYEQIFERIINRSQLMNTTILQRLQKSTRSLTANERIQRLRNETLSHGWSN